MVVRVLGILVSMAAAAALVYSTQLGKGLWQFIQGSRAEIRKVVWPTRHETMQTTIAVFVFLMVLGIFFWVLDLALLMITRALTGQGS
ncbi:MAG: preprotein translocase subunit SecE [Gammaproteobacteria bacterium]